MMYAFSFAPREEPVALAVIASCAVRNVRFSRFLIWKQTGG